VPEYAALTSGKSDCNLAYKQLIGTSRENDRQTGDGRCLQRKGDRYIGMFHNLKDGFKKAPF
jgi:hypothetical protein